MVISYNKCRFSFLFLFFQNYSVYFQRYHLFDWVTIKVIVCSFNVLFSLVYWSSLLMRCDALEISVNFSFFTCVPNDKKRQTGERERERQKRHKEPTTFQKHNANIAIQLNQHTISAVRLCFYVITKCLSISSKFFFL